MEKNNSNKTANRDSALPTISIFSGILGIELGLEKHGFKTRFALDFDKHCKDVVEDNRDKFGDFPYICDDINKISADYVLKVSGLKPGETAILAGGPPCQPFSKSGLRKGSEDARGLLFKHYLDYLNVIKPQAFILENVRGLFSSNKGEDFKMILDHFDDTGYTIYWKILDAANYGVPQFRQRLIIVGFRERIKFKFPTETHGDPAELRGMLFNEKKPFVTVEEAFDKLIENNKGSKLNGKYGHLLLDIPEGMNYSFYTSERNHPKPLFKWRSKFWYFLLKIDRKKPSLTIQAYPGNNTGPFHWENRRLSIEELKRLQTFSDWLRINKSYMVAHRLIGNAVPPVLAEAIGKTIKETLDKKEPLTKEEHEEIRIDGATKNGVVKSGRGSGKGKVSVKNHYPQAILSSIS